MDIGESSKVGHHDEAVTAVSMVEEIGSSILTVIDEPRVTEGTFTQ